MEITELLKTLRSKKGYTMKQVAELCGMHEQVYRNYENGARNPGVPALCKFADLYGVTVDFLLGRENKNSDASNDKYADLPDEVKSIIDAIADYAKSR